MFGWLDRLLAAGSSSPSKLDLAGKNYAQPQLDLWAMSPEREWYMVRRTKVWRFVVLGFAFLLAAALLAQPGWRSPSNVWWAIILTLAAAVSLIYCTFPYFASRRAFRDRRRSLTTYRAEVALSKLGDDPELPASSVVRTQPQATRCIPGGLPSPAAQRVSLGANCEPGRIGGPCRRGHPVAATESGK